MVQSGAEEAGDWIGVAEAARLVPSPKPGKKTHLSTIHRWRLKGLLECRKRGRFFFVRRADVLALLQPGAPVRQAAPAEGAREAAARRAAADKILREAGLY